MMVRVVMEERQTRHEVRKSGIRIEKPETLPSSMADVKIDSQTHPAAFTQLGFFFRALLFLAYLFSAFTIYLAYVMHR